MYKRPKEHLEALEALKEAKQFLEKIQREENTSRKRIKRSPDIKTRKSTTKR